VGQEQIKSSDALHSPEAVQKSRQQAQGDAKWDDVEAVDRASASFQAASNMIVNPKATGTGAKGNPGKPI
jgi:hypothetical protein